RFFMFCEFVTKPGTMKKRTGRREFIRNIGLGSLGAVALPGSALAEKDTPEKSAPKPRKSARRSARQYNDYYTGSQLNRIAFPIGGIGSGMFCMEGTGAISHMSIRHRPELFHEPTMFAALSVKGLEKGAKILEGPVPDWKKFGYRGAGNGSGGT